jgi:hypothetical protein
MSLIPLCAACEVEQVVKGLQGFVEIQQPVAESVSLGDLQKLRAAGPMSRYEIQMHDELQSMLAGGKPKAIAAIEDSFAATFECPRQIGLCRQGGALESTPDRDNADNYLAFLAAAAARHGLRQTRICESLAGGTGAQTDRLIGTACPAGFAGPRHEGAPKWDLGAGSGEPALGE